MKRYKFRVLQPFAIFRGEIYSFAEVRKISTFLRETDMINTDGARRYDPRRGSSSKYYFDYVSKDVNMDSLTQKLLDGSYIQLVGTTDNWGTNLPEKAFSTPFA